MTKVYVGGFKHSLDEIELAKLFMPFGQVSTIKMVRDKKTRVSKGCAFMAPAQRHIITNITVQTLMFTRKVCAYDFIDVLVFSR